MAEASTKPTRRHLPLYARVLVGVVLGAILGVTFGTRPYLFGGRPSMADFGLAGQLKQLASDPTPSSMIKAQAPNLTRWIERMEDPKAEGGFAAFEAVRGDLTDLLREEVRLESVERFHVILLNTRRRLIRVENLSQGTLDSLLVHPREVFRSAIAANASALVLAHNHPSGDPTPSDSDIKVTRDLIRAGQLLKIDVLDHIILGRASKERSRDFVSLRELGYFYT